MIPTISISQGLPVVEVDAGNGNDTVSVGTATGFSDAGDDTINLGDGVDYVYYNAGADKDQYRWK